MIKVIIFDMGSVVYRTDWDKLNKQFKEKFGFDIRLFNNEKLIEIYNNANIGKATVRDMIIFLDHEKDDDKIVKYYKKYYFNSKIVNEEMIKIINNLKKRYPLYAITDTIKEHYESNKENKIFNNFKKVFASHELGRRKDDLTVFKDVIKEIGFKPEEVIFIDDYLPNIENAKKVGLKTIHYKDFPKMEKFNEELKKILRENLPFRKNCEGYLVFGKDLVGRNTEYGYIDFPGGGVEDGEDLKEALKREAFEEAGVILEGELKEVGNIKTIWPNDWAKNEKQIKRFEKYQGDDMHFFIGKVKELVNPSGDKEENGWDLNERLIPIKKAIEIIESYKPFPKELDEYYKFKLKILRSLQDASN